MKYSLLQVDFFGVLQGLKKPYNPIIGETFRCFWKHPKTNSRTFYLAEQVGRNFKDNNSSLICSNSSCVCVCVSVRERERQTEIAVKHLCSLTCRSPITRPSQPFISQTDRMVLISVAAFWLNQNFMVGNPVYLWASIAANRILLKLPALGYTRCIYDAMNLNPVNHLIYFIYPSYFRLT